MRSHVVVRALSVAALLAVGGLAPSSPVHAAPKGWKLSPHARHLGDDVYEISSKQEGDHVRFCWAIIDRAHDARPSGGGSGPKGGGGSTAYTYLAAGMKWKGTSESYRLDASGAAGHTDGTLSDADIHALVAGAIGHWEDAANGAVGDGASVNIMAGEVAGPIDVAGIGDVYNGANEVCFAPIAEAGVIAVTYVWGNYYGPTKQRQIVEWDQIYDNDGDWTWSGLGAAGAMDFLNIATHEIGHALGMGHSPSTATEETMYAYAGLGETKKRTLNAGDVAGISNLY